jgi:hypothetical protein
MDQGLAGSSRKVSRPIERNAMATATNAENPWLQIKKRSADLILTERDAIAHIR